MAEAAEEFVVSDFKKWSPHCREHYFPRRSERAAVVEKKGIAEGGITEAYPGYEIGRANPGFHLLLYTFKGRGQVFSRHPVRYVSRDQVLLIPAGTSFRYKPHRGRWSFLWFHLTDTGRWRHLGDESIVVRNTSLMTQMENAMAEFLRESHGISRSSPRAARLYAELIALYIEREFGHSVETEGTDLHIRLDKLWDKVNANLDQNWDVDRLAEELHVSVAHLHRMALAATGTSPMRMVTRLRMERAQDLLIILDCKIRNVAEMVGYHNEFAFSVAFKRFCGVTPGEFRKQR
jgi:AraC-like DNA-binding protein